MPQGYPSQAQSALGGLLTGIGQYAGAQQRFKQEQALKQAYWNALAQKEQAGAEAAARAKEQDRAFQMMMQQEREAAADRRLGRQLAAKSAQGAAKTAAGAKDEGKLYEQLTNELMNFSSGYDTAQKANLYDRTAGNVKQHALLFGDWSKGALGGLTQGMATPEAVQYRDQMKMAAFRLAPLLAGSNRPSMFLQQQLLSLVPPLGVGKEQAKAARKALFSTVRSLAQAKLNEMYGVGNAPKAEETRSKLENLFGSFESDKPLGPGVALEGRLYVPTEKAAAAQPTDWTANQPWSPKQTLGGGLGVTQPTPPKKPRLDRVTALQIKQDSQHPDFLKYNGAADMLKTAQEDYPEDFQ